MSRSWLFGTSIHRSRAQAPLLVAITAVTLLSSTLVTSLAVLVTATEQSGVQVSLANVPSEQSRIEVRLLDPIPTVGAAREAMDVAIADVLGKGSTFTATQNALSPLVETTLESPNPSFAYFGELERVAENTELVDGRWPTAAGEVAIPRAAAKSFELGVGDAIQTDRVSTIVGVFEPSDQRGAFWSIDFLNGAGHDPAFPKPNVSAYEPISAMGPLVVGPGGLDDAQILAAFVEVIYETDVSATTVAGLQPLIDRLDDADIQVRRALGGVGEGVLFQSDLLDTTSSISTGLITTRSTVVVVGLLLLLIAVSAMAQTARLFTDARAVERQLMRSRGASSRHILAFAIVEAVAIGAVTAVASPGLATLVYSGFARQPALVAAGMPSSVVPPVLAWVVAGATSILFIVVMVAPLLRKAPSVDEGVRSRGRQGAAPALLRSGVDVAALALAAVAVWQLQSYRSVVDTSGAGLSIDPVLAVAPAVVLLAGALLAARLIPLVARVVERFGAGARGVVVPLASWEVGRRAQRATAAVLLLSMALAVGTFGLSFLETWKLSQVDQAQVAVGAPVRLPADEAMAGAQPVSRIPGQLGSRDVTGEAMVNSGAQVLGLSEGARAFLTRGRLAEVGGKNIDRSLDERVPESAGFAIDDALAFDVTVSAAEELEGVGVEVTAIVEDDRGELTAVGLGVVIPGEKTAVSAEVPEGAVRVVGVQLVFAALPGGDELPGDEVSATVSISGLGENDGQTWGAVGPFASPRPTVVAGDSELELSLIVPGDVSVRSATFAAVGWEPVVALSAVVSEELARAEYLSFGARVTVFVDGAAFDATVDAFADLVPGAARTETLSAGGFGAAAQSGQGSTIVVDHRLLQRVLAQGGAPIGADEWWLDTDDGVAWMSRHPIDGAVAADSLARDLQESPIRIAVQVALWLVIIAAALLSTIGFAMHATTSVRARRFDFAQLAALGVPRRSIVAVVAIESLLLGVIGAVAGTGIGLALVSLVAPLVAVSPDGSQPVPSVIVEVPWMLVLALASGVVAVTGLVALALSRGRSLGRPAALLRWGGE